MSFRKGQKRGVSLRRFSFLMLFFSLVVTAALLYTERFPTGSLTEMRFDAALVDGCGQVDIIENAFGDN